MEAEIDQVLPGADKQPLVNCFDPEAPLPPGFPLPPDSILRELGSEPIVAVVGVLRAAAMDAMHPEIAAAVYDHSNIMQKPLSRVLATADAAFRMLYLDAEDAKKVAAKIHKIHQHAHGHLKEGGGPWHAGDAYSAHDAFAQAWVWATILDSTETIYERYVRQLEPDEKEDLYADFVAFARFFGIPEESLPSDRKAFQAYLEDTIASEQLTSTLSSRKLARAVLSINRITHPQALLWPINGMVKVSLDPRLTKRIGQEPGAKDYIVDSAVRGSYHHLPSFRRELPKALVIGDRFMNNFYKRAASLRAQPENS